FHVRELMLKKCKNDVVFLGALARLKRGPRFLVFSARNIAAMHLMTSRIAMVNSKCVIGLDFDYHSSQDPRSPILTGILLPSNIRRYPVKASTLQNDWLAAVVAQERAAIGSHGCQGTNGRLATTCGRLGNLLGIGLLHFEFFDLLEIGLVYF